MQVQRLQREVDTQKKEKEALQAWASDTEKKTKELGSKIEKVCYQFS